jgi:hypothetical protein
MKILLEDYMNMLKLVEEKEVEIQILKAGEEVHYREGDKIDNSVDLNRESTEKM